MEQPEVDLTQLMAQLDADDAAYCNSLTYLQTRLQETQQIAPHQAQPNFAVNSQAALVAAQQAAANFQQQMMQNPLLQQLNEAAKQDRIARDYGEQCADTDGLAVLAVVPELDGDANLIAALRSEIVQLLGMASKLERRAEQAERNLERTIAERDALRVELNQRMAMPARALKFSV